jgi:hypothetical protein
MFIVVGEKWEEYDYDETNWKILGVFDDVEKAFEQKKDQLNNFSEVYIQKVEKNTDCSYKILENIENPAALIQNKEGDVEMDARIKHKKTKNFYMENSGRILENEWTQWCSINMNEWTQWCSIHLKEYKMLQNIDNQKYRELLMEWKDVVDKLVDVDNMWYKEKLPALNRRLNKCIEEFDNSFKHEKYNGEFRLELEDFYSQGKKRINLD